MIYKDKEYDVDGVLFDVDGTIWDSTGVVTEAWNKALIDTGFGYVQVTADRLKGLFGLPMMDIMRDILPGVDDSEIHRFEDVCNAYEEEFLIEKAGDIYDGIGDVIKELSKTRKVIIVSNCQSGYINVVMKHVGIEEYVIDNVCPGDSGMLKAENIMYMCEKHNIKCPVYVGDTHMDEEACKKAGVPIIFASYGFGHVDEPLAVMKEPKDLLTILDGE